MRRDSCMAILLAPSQASAYAAPHHFISDLASPYHEGVGVLSIAALEEAALPDPISEASRAEAQDKDSPLREDIRLLGRLLGDTVREQEGGAIFDIVERIRQASIRFHRDGEMGD